MAVNINAVPNIVKAAAEGLKQLSSPAETAARRDTSVGKIFGWEE